MIDLKLGDCLDLFPTLAPQSIDAVIADIPYGTTACKWDTVIPFEPMWEQLKRIAKPKAAIVLFGSQPFTSALVMSNPKWFRYEWVWDKIRVTGIANAKRRPLVSHENIIIFSEHGHSYTPQLTGKGARPFGKIVSSAQSDIAAAMPLKRNFSMGYPKSILREMRPNNLTEGYFHPTQKPVALMEYLVRTYTNEGDTVLDFTMGSGTTMVACVNTKRNGIGWELDAGYFEIAQNRVKEAQRQLILL